MGKQATLNITLTPRLQRYVDAKLASGRYSSADEVVRESLRTAEKLESVETDFWIDVRGKLAEAKQNIRDGKVSDGQASLEKMEAWMTSRGKRKRRSLP